MYSVFRQIAGEEDRAVLASEGGLTDYGILSTMTITIDRAGRLVIPKKIRQAAGLEAGSPLSIRYEAGKIEIEPEPARIRFVRKGRFLVAVADGEVPPLKNEVVEQTIKDLRRGRGSTNR